MTKLLKILLTTFLLLFFSNTEAQILYWGITNKGGTYNVGTIFYTNKDGSEQTIVHSFNYGDGDSPIGSLISASDGHLYGTTTGGNSDYGVIFKYDDDQFQYQKVFEFNGSSEGYHPTGHLVSHEGKIYGMTRNGGEDQSGVIFEYMPGSTEIEVKKFFTGLDGAYPEGGLTVGSNGLLYGLTSYGGELNLGVLFVFDPATEDYEVLHDFNPSDGMIPVCNLLESSNGKLYGVTPKGGEFNSGILFEYDIISETYTKLVEFNGENAGSEPAGSLIEAENGLLYGMAMKDEISAGNSFGTIYSYDITNFQVSKLFTFDGLDGALPTGSLTETADGRLIGMTDKGGSVDGGVRFEYNITDNSFIKKIDFNGENGRLPIYGAFLEVYYVGINDESLQQKITIYPNPASNYIEISFNHQNTSFDYSLFTVSGELIDHGNVDGSNTMIKTDQLFPGTYILKLKSKDVTHFKKVLIR